MPKKLTQQEFIRRAIFVHGNKFNYSKVIYISAHNKIIIGCHIHGDFLQTPNHHVLGDGCLKCADEKRAKDKTSNIEEFIEKARLVHGDKYDYTNSNYGNNRVKLVIKCSKHDYFLQIPKDHLRGAGCPECGNEQIGNKLRSNREIFIEKSNKVHMFMYGYDKVVYISSKDNVNILCKKHGYFLQTPTCHLNGSGCPECSYEKNGNRCRSNTDEFIEKAKLIHGDKYGYSQVYYKTAIDKIIITCYKHGVFKQTPNGHLCGKGCPSCNSSKGEIAIRDILQKHNIAFQQEYMIPESNTRFEYDFYLSDYNLLIEFHGGQHYFPIEYFGGEKAFILTRRNDSLKLDLAKMAGIRIVYFNYKHIRMLNKEQFENFVIRRIKTYYAT